MSARPSFLDRWLGGLLFGHDGRVSYAKVMGWAILGAYTLRAGVPELVATFLLAGAHGGKMLNAWLARGSFALSASSSTARTDTRSEARTESVTRQVQEIHARRDPGAGFEVTR